MTLNNIYNFILVLYDNWRKGAIASRYNDKTVSWFDELARFWINCYALAPLSL
jgi:hypothetical protein